MQSLKSTLFILILSLLFTEAYASKHNCNINTNVPFQNVNLNPNCTITANYSFGPHAIVFCYTTDLPNQDKITWPYNGAFYSYTLPVSLKTNSQFEGQFADPEGFVIIQNTNNVSFQANCLFGY
jgi:hypothetical protein